MGTKFSFKAGSSFLLDYKQEYFGVLTSVEEFENPKNKSQGGFKFHFDIINSKPLEEGDDNETSRGKSLKVSYWANGRDDEGNWTFPETGKYRNLLESLSDFLELDMDDINEADDLLGGVVRFYVTNDRTMNGEKIYSNIDSDTVKSIKSSDVEKVRAGLEKYLEWKSKNDKSSKNIKTVKKSDTKPKPKKEDFEPEEESDDTFEEPEEKPKSKSKSKPKKEEESDDDDWGDEEPEEKPKSKSKSKPKKEEEEESDNDDFFS